MDYLFLVRHGATKANEEGINAGTLNYPLSAGGRKDVAYIAKTLSKIEITSVYCSPVFRAVQTARIIAKHHHHRVELRIMNDLTEVKLKQRFVGKEGRQHILTTPQAFDETYEELQRRMIRSYNTIKRETKSGIALVVSHGDPLNALLRWIVGDTEPTRHYTIHPDTASLSIVETKTAQRIVLFNYRRGMFDDFQESNEKESG